MIDSKRKKRKKEKREFFLSEFVVSFLPPK